jgi:hypothetical protein
MLTAAEAACDRHHSTNTTRIGKAAAPFLVILERVIHSRGFDKRPTPTLDCRSRKFLNWEMILSGIMTQPTSCIAVFERRPYWGPELLRQFFARNIQIRECRALSDLVPATNDFATAAILLDFASAPVDCLLWLGRQFREPLRLPVIACASTELADLEWTIREAGAIAFVGDEVSGRELARLCLRQLRLA